MKLEYKRELDHNYLILEEEREDAKEGYEIYMLEENQIPGLLKCTLQRLNQQQRFCYEVTSRQSLDILLERKRLTYKDLMGLLKGIHRAILGAREYLLDVNHLMLLPEYLYLNLDTNLPELCYFPYYEKPIREQFFDLSEYLLGKLDRQDREGVELGYEIYKMASEENCSLEEILKLQSKKTEQCPASADKVRLFWENAGECEASMLPSMSFAASGMRMIAEPENTYGMETKAVKQKKKRFWEKRKKEEQPKQLKQERVVWRRETGVLEEGSSAVIKSAAKEQVLPQGETCLLSNEQGRNLVLYSTNPSIGILPVRGESFLIGTKKEAVDGLIIHPTISRIHAKIEKKEEKYYLTDLNSTNGTYLNDRLLEVNETVMLNVGDSVRFAEVEYTVGT